jgi:3-phenylpropionate/trans-cinnamate dioxygenase ferredoxin reductase subunit
MEDQRGRLVVIGTGCAGVELAFAARAMGWSGSIVLVGDDPAVPYQRPPLSKAYLMGEMNFESLWLRAPALYEKSRIELLTGVHVAAIDRVHMRVQLCDGREVPYDHLGLMVGGRPRPLPAAMRCTEGVLNFHYLRTVADSAAIHKHFGPGRRLVVVGGGYVGLEVAAAAVKSNMRVTVLEALPRVLARVTAPLLSAFYEDVHRQAGVDVRTGDQVDGFELSPDGSQITAVHCAGGTSIAADVVVAGIGLIPNVELASGAGLAVENGIVVDSLMRTTDPSIFAGGDCTCFYSELYERTVRLESVPNALGQARTAAAVLCGKKPREDAVPWFWSDQYDLNLKMVGLSQGYDRVIVRGSPASRSFSAFYMLGDRVLAMDTVNRPQEFNLSKRLIADRRCVDAALLADDMTPFKRIIESGSEGGPADAGGASGSAR